MQRIILLSLLAALLAGCSSTIPLTPKIGVDFGIVAVRIGGVAELEWRGTDDESDVPEDNSGSGR